ncbi:MAG: hypothetical protein ACHQ2Z_09405 [Elusimicrobiota bacterium]
MIKPLGLALFFSALAVHGGTASAQTPPEGSAPAAARGALTRLTLALQPLRRDEYESQDRRAFDERLNDLHLQITAARPSAALMSTPRGEAWRALARKVEELTGQENEFWAGIQDPDARQKFPAKTAEPLTRRMTEVSAAFPAAFPEPSDAREQPANIPQGAARLDQHEARASATVQNGVKPLNGAARTNPARFFDGTQAGSGEAPAPVPAAPSQPARTAAAGANAPMTELPMEPRQTLHVNAVPALIPPPSDSSAPKPRSKTLIALRATAPGALHDAVAATPLLSPAARALETKRDAAANPPQAKPDDAAQHAAPTAESACAEALKDHSSLMAMCKDHPDIAPFLGGMLDALKDQFGSLGAVAMNIGFLIVGLLLSALSGFGLVAKIVVSLASFAMLIGTIGPLLAKGGEAVWDLVHSKAEDAKHAQAMMSIGKVSGAVLIMALMAALGWGAGKTSIGKSMMGTATDAVSSTLSKAFAKTGMTDGLAALDAKVPPFLRNFFGAGPAKPSEGAPSGEAKPAPSKSASTKTADAAPGGSPQGTPADAIKRSAKSKALVDEQTVRDNANIKDRDVRINETMKQLGVDREFAKKVADAHDAVPCDVGDCKAPQLRAKMKIMGDSPKSAEAIRRGLAGNAPAAKPVSLLETIDPTSLPSAGKLHSPEQWGELVAETHDAGAKAVMKTNEHGTNPYLRVELANGEKVSGRFLGVDGNKMVFESDGKLVGLDRGSGVTKVSRLADAVFQGGDRSPVEVVVHDAPPVVDPFKDLAAYKGRVVDIAISDLEDMQEPPHTVTGRIVEVDGKTVVLQGEKGAVRIKREYHQIDSVAQRTEAYASHGKITSAEALNGTVRGGTPVDLALTGEKTVSGLFRGVHRDEEGLYVLLETPNGSFRAYRSFHELRTASSAGSEILYTHPAR